MSTVEQELEQAQLEERRDDACDRLRMLAIEAWHAYAQAVHRREAGRIRRRAFELAVKAERAIADAVGDRPWPLRSVEWRRGGSD